jgi:hypothetical protein
MEESISDFTRQLVDFVVPIQMEVTELPCSLLAKVAGGDIGSGLLPVIKK